MNDLTIFVIPVDEKGHDLLLRSMKNLSELINLTVIEIPERDFNLPIDTAWKLFMYSDECFGSKLLEALPVLVQTQGFEYFSFYKAEAAPKNSLMHSLSPRMFRADVNIKKDSIYPENTKPENGTVILDGYILDRGTYLKSQMPTGAGLRLVSDRI